MSQDFDAFFYAGATWHLRRQIAWLSEQLSAAAGAPTFTFLNIGETHVPYYFEGADWQREDNPCKPFQTVDRAETCRLRQRACLEHVDGLIASLLEAHMDATIIACRSRRLLGGGWVVGARGES